MTISPGASVTAAVLGGAAVDATIASAVILPAGVGTQTYRDREPYTGDYEAVPSRHEQVFATAGKSMQLDFTVTEIPYYTTTNIGGGYTAIISEE
jgi:hypothetical protein